MKIELEQTVEAPVAKGQILGTARFLLDGEEVLRKELYAVEEVEKKTFGFSFSALARRFFCL